MKDKELAIFILIATLMVSFGVGGYDIRLGLICEGVLVMLAIRPLIRWIK